MLPIRTQLRCCQHLLRKFCSSESRRTPRRIIYRNVVLHMIKNDIISSEEGRQFLLGQEYIRRLTDINPSNNETIYTSLSVNFVLTAFAAELFIKCIYNILGIKPKKEHKLKVLFDDLNNYDNGKKAYATIQILFKNRMEEYSKKVINSGLPEKVKKSFLTRIEDLDESLTSINDTFVLWRYIYEEADGKENIGLSQFTSALRDYIIESKPGWINN